MIRPIAAALAAAIALAPAAGAETRYQQRVPYTSYQPQQRTGPNPSELIGGLALLGLTLYAFKELSDDGDRGRDRGVTVHRPGKGYGRHHYDGVRRYGRVLPSACRLNARGTRSGQLYGARCLDRHYGHRAALPEACRLQVASRGRAFHAYGQTCLGRYGWATARSR